MEEARRWDDYFERVRYLDYGRLERDELAPKRALGRDLGEVRAGKSDWTGVMKKKDFRTFIGRWGANYLRKWFQENPVESRDALRQLWAAGDQSRETDDSMEETVNLIRDFAKLMPAYGAGSRMRVISVLLWTLDAERYPLFMKTKFDETYKDIFPDEGPGKGADEADLYRYALEFLDRLRLAGRAKKSTKGGAGTATTCRYVKLWHAGAMTGAVRRGPGLGGTPGTCASNTSNEKTQR